MLWCEDELNHLIFADDGILCSKGEFVSVYKLQGFQHFFEVSSLEVSKQKTELYAAGMQREEI